MPHSGQALGSFEDTWITSSFIDLTPSVSPSEHFLVGHLRTDGANQEFGNSVGLKPDLMSWAQFVLYLIHERVLLSSLLRARPTPISGSFRVITELQPNEGKHDARLKEIFVSFNEAWVKYWGSYAKLQDQLYEVLRAGREVSWLAATDERKLSEINQVQRELFEGMPRRLDYSPLGQISRDMNSAPSKIAELETALAEEEEGCKRLEAAIALMKEKVEVMKEAIRVADS